MVPKLKPCDAYESPSQAQHAWNALATASRKLGPTETQRFRIWLAMRSILKPCGPQLGPNCSQMVQPRAKLRYVGRSWSQVGRNWAAVGAILAKVDPKCSRIETAHSDDVVPICKPTFGALSWANMGSPQLKLHQTDRPIRIKLPPSVRVDFFHILLMGGCSACGEPLGSRKSKTQQLNYP